MTKYDKLVGHNLDWNYKESFKCFLNNVDIESFIKLNGKDNINIIQGIYFDDKIHG